MTEVPALSFFGSEIREIHSLFYFILAVALGLYLFVIDSCGRLLARRWPPFAARGTEIRAEFFGYNSANYTENCNLLHRGLCGRFSAGALFATVTEFVSPTLLGVRVFHGSPDIGRSGRERGLAGFLSGTVCLVMDSLRPVLLHILTYWIMVLGLFFVVCVMFFPRGIFGSLLSERKQKTGRAL